jgi:polysaccharide transporter, PST family
MLARVLRNSAWQVGDKVSRMGAGVFVSIYVARYLGPTGYGLLSFSVALVALFSAVASCGLQQVVVRDLITHPGDRAVILGSAQALRLAGGAVAMVLAVATTALLRPGDGQSLLLVLMVACCALPTAWDVIDYDYQSRIDTRPIVIARNTSFAVLAALRVLLVLLRAPLVCFGAALVGETALSALLMARRWRADGLRVPLAAASWPRMRSLLLISWPLMIAGFSVSVYMRVDQVMLAKMLGNAGVGLFSAAIRVSEGFYFVPIAVCASVAPVLTATRARSPAEYAQRFLKVTRLLVWLAIAVAAGFTVFSHYIILMLYGPKYVAAAGVLSVHAWAGVLVSLGLCSNLWLTNEGYLRYQMYQTLAGAAVNIVLNLVLIPRLGIVGAAFASCAAQFASVMLIMVILPNTRRLFRLQLAAFLPLFRGARAFRLSA